jgi:hypothetical protein
LKSYPRVSEISLSCTLPGVRFYMSLSPLNLNLEVDQFLLNLSHRSDRLQPPRVSLRAKFYSVLSVFFCRSDDITCTSDRDVTAAGGRYGETNLEEIDQLLSLNLKEKETYRI